MQNKEVGVLLMFQLN